MNVAFRGENIMEKIRTVCRYCSEKHCCRGLCREMNDYLLKERKKKNERKRYVR